MKHCHSLLRVVLGVALLTGCGSPSTTPSHTATASPSAIPSPSVEPERTLPPSQVAIEPGTYTWDEFTPAVSFEVGPGWEVGHRNPVFFDLFVDGDFPAISFGRFEDVFTGPTSRVPARDAATLIETLSAYSGLTMSTPEPIDLAGLRGQAFTLSASVDQTPLFGAPNGVFRMDPGFETRYSALDVTGGGVLLVGVVAYEGDLEEALELAAPVLASLTVAKTS